MIVVFIVVLVVFGPQKLPELARGLGKLMAEFRKASMDFKTAFEEEMRDLERQALVAERKKAADAATAAAAAEPIQPATMATPSGAETPSSEGPADTRATEAPVISAVTESVARSGEDAADINAEAATPVEPEESQHDAQRPA